MVGENRALAAHRIAMAYQHNEVNLGLSNFGLSVLPEGVFSELDNLQR